MTKCVFCNKYIVRKSHGESVEPLAKKLYTRIVASNENCDEVVCGQLVHRKCQIEYRHKPKVWKYTVLCLFIWHQTEILFSLLPRWTLDLTLINSCIHHCISHSDAHWRPLMKCFPGFCYSLSFRLMCWACVNMLMLNRELTVLYIGGHLLRVTTKQRHLIMTLCLSASWWHTGSLFEGVGKLPNLPKYLTFISSLFIFPFFPACICSLVLDLSCVWLSNIKL